MSPEQAMTIAQQGRCAEAIPGLKRALTGQTSPDVKKNAGILGIRCSLTVDNRDSAVEFIRLLSKQFPKDPDVMFIVVHAYSDLSSRTAQDLARTAPQSIAAHKLNAEAFEMQGNWSEAEHEYEMMIAKDPTHRRCIFCSVGCCSQNQTQTRTPPIVRNRNFRKSWKSIPRMLARITSWGNWRGAKISVTKPPSTLPMPPNWTRRSPKPISAGVPAGKTSEICRSHSSSKSSGEADAWQSGCALQPGGRVEPDRSERRSAKGIRHSS